METTFRHYTSQWGCTPDYELVRAFLVELGYREYTYARWDWMTTHPNLDLDAVRRIGLWENDGRLLGLATFDCQVDQVFLLTRPGYEALKPEMLAYALNSLNNGAMQLMIRDDDAEMQRIAAERGFVRTDSGEWDMVFLPDETSTDYALPEGFSITDMQQRYDLYQYGRVLWQGFNHELDGEGTFDEQLTPESEARGTAEMLRPHVDLSLKIAAVAPDGNFAGYCGLWYEPAAGFAVVEPLAVAPAYRKLGLGRAVVHEGIKRVAARGAKRVFVGSEQEFYARVGFRKYAFTAAWVLR